MKHPFLAHPLYTVACRSILRRAARGGNTDARKILNDGDMFRAFMDVASSEVTLPEVGDDPLPPIPPNPDHPFIQWIQQIIQYFIENPEKLIAIIKMIMALFGA